jgi:hypothetical protein
MATSQTCCHLPGEMLNSAAECAYRARIRLSIESGIGESRKICLGAKLRQQWMRRPLDHWTEKAAGVSTNSPKDYEAARLSREFLEEGSDGSESGHLLPTTCLYVDVLLRGVG